MIGPTLSECEVAAVRAAARMEIVRYPGGSVAATDGKHTLFAAGGAESFAALWRQAEEIRAEVKG